LAVRRGFYPFFDDFKASQPAKWPSQAGFRHRKSPESRRRWKNARRNWPEGRRRSSEARRNLKNGRRKGNFTRRRPAEGGRRLKMAKKIQCSFRRG
jgi:hypothetical protein